MFEISGYDVGKLVYSGARSKVYRGTRLKDQMRVIVKVNSEPFASNQRAESLRNEFLLGSSITSDSILTYVDLVTFPGGYAVVSRDMGGEALSSHIPQYGYSLEHFFVIAVQIVKGLLSIHQEKISHRYLSAENIFINPESMEVRIGDFSRATRTESEILASSTASLSLQDLQYSSPELMGRMNRAVDYRTDFYSLGVVLYQLLVGLVPFEDDDPLEIVHAHIARRPPSLMTVKPEIPAAISEIVMKLLAKNAEDRYQSASGLLLDIEECQRQWRASGVIDAFVPGLGDVAANLFVQQKLYGRAPESQKLTAAFQSARDGKATLVLVSGVAGVGKSALVGELNHQVAASGGFYLSAKFEQFNVNVALSAVKQLLRLVLRQITCENDKVYRAWCEHLQVACGDQGYLVANLVPEIEQFIGKSQPPESGDPETERNRFIQTLLRIFNAFAKPAHPLVIFLDDIQWADDASIKLMKRLLTQGEEQSLLVIVAYRSEELSGKHAIHKIVKNAKEAGTQICEIKLKPLGLSSVESMLTNALSNPAQSSHELAKLVLERTRGNPFFLKTFVQSLYEQDVLHFDKSNGWCWDYNRITQIQATDDVVELMLQRIELLSESAQEILKISACLGFQFSHAMLEKMLPNVDGALDRSLDEILQTGMLYRIGDGYQFIHDHILKAAYSLSTFEEKQHVHLDIGRVLLEELDKHEADADVFKVLDNFIVARHALSEEESQRLAHICLDASKIALATSAYDAVIKYCTLGLDFLNALISTEQDGELAVQLYKCRAEGEHLSGRFVEAEKSCLAAIALTKNAIEKADCYSILVVLYTMSARFEDAIAAGKNGLSLLGIELDQLPEAPIKNMQEMLGHREIKSLIDIPEMKADDKKVALKLLLKLVPTSIISDKNLYPIVVAERIRISLNYGYVPESSAGYAAFAILLVAFEQDYANAIEFGRLALDLSERYKSGAQKCRVLSTLGTYLLPWVEPIKNCREYNLKAYDLGLEFGELQFAGYALADQLFNEIYQGADLDTIKIQITHYKKYIINSRNMWALDKVMAVEIFVKNMTGEETALIDWSEPVDAEQYWIAECEKHRSHSALCSYYTLKAKYHYVHRQFGAALKAIEKAQGLVDYTWGTIVFAECFILRLMIRLALHAEKDSDDPNDQKAFWHDVHVQLAQIETWVKHCEENFLHRYEFLLAEIAWQQGDLWGAPGHYERSIAHAEKFGFMQEQALANERAARFWFINERMTFFRLFIDRAMYCYHFWGADSYRAELNSEFADNVQTREYFKRIQPNDAIDLDMLAVVKASQSISKEIDRDQLLHKMVGIIRTISGAQRCALILSRQKDLFVEVLADDDRAVIPVLPILANRADFLAHSIVQYVWRTEETVLLNDANRKGAFVSDRYVIRHQPKSLLVQPVKHKGENIGVLYLENNLAANVFSDETITIVGTLLGQACISLENAVLFAETQKLNAELVNEIEDRMSAEIENEKLILQLKDRHQEMERFTYTVSHDLKVPLTGIMSILGMLEEDVSEGALEQLPRHLATIKGESERMKQLIKQLLEVSKLEHQENQVEEVSLQRVLNECVQQITHQSRGKKVKISVLNEMPTVRGDELRLREVLQNLLENAIKFSVNTQVPKVEIASEAHGDFAHIHIRDNGIGIAENYQEKIFGLFNRLNSDIEGTGVGLAIVKTIVEKHGGCIWVASKGEGNGSTFSFSIPISRPNSESSSISSLADNAE